MLKKLIFNHDKLQTFLAKKFFWICFHETAYGKETYKILWNSPLSQWYKLSFKNKIEFKLRCLFKVQK